MRIPRPAWVNSTFKSSAELRRLKFVVEPFRSGARMRTKFLLMKVCQILSLIALPLAFSSVQAEESLRLRQAFPVGKKLTQSMKMEQVSRMKAGGQEVETKSSTDMRIIMTIRAGEADQKRLTLKYDKASMKNEIPENLGGGQAAPVDYLAGLVGKEITVVLDGKDQVQGVEGLDDLLKGADENQAAIWKQLLTEDQMKQMINGSILQALPEKEIKSGDSWPFRQEIALPIGLGKAVTEGNYQLKSIKEDLAEIAIKGTMKIEGPAVSAKEAPYEGSILFDSKLGLPRMTDMRIKMDIEAKIGPKGESMKMQMDQTVKSEITEVVEAK